MAQETWRELVVGDSPMRVYHSVPGEVTRRRGGVLMIHGGYGLEEPGAFRLARRLALTGYLVMAPDLYHRQAESAEAPPERRPEGTRRLRWDEAQRDLRATLDALQASDGVGDKLAVLGFGLGGALAWLSAAAFPVRTAVVFYPHDLFEPFGAGGPVPFAATGDLSCPVLGHFGAADTNPSPADMERLDAALAERQLPHQFYLYQGAGHGFVSAAPERHHPMAANTATDRTVGWLDRHLRA